MITAVRSTPNQHHQPEGIIMATLTETVAPVPVSTPSKRTTMLVVGAVAALAVVAFGVVGAAASDGTIGNRTVSTYVTGQTANVGPSVSDYPASAQR
jgi:hypothetical protein